MNRVETLSTSIGNFNFKLKIEEENNKIFVCVQCLLDKCDDDCLLSIQVEKGTDEAILSDYYSEILKD